MNYNSIINQRVQVIKAQALMIEEMSKIPEEDLSNWDIDFRSSITRRFTERRRELTEKQCRCIINILAWDKIDQS